MGYRIGGRETDLEIPLPATLIRLFTRIGCMRCKSRIKLFLSQGLSRGIGRPRLYPGEGGGSRKRGPFLSFGGRGKNGFNQVAGVFIAILPKVETLSGGEFGWGGTSVKR